MEQKKNIKVRYPNIKSYNKRVKYQTKRLLQVDIFTQRPHTRQIIDFQFVNKKHFQTEPTK